MGKYVLLENGYWTGAVDSKTDVRQFRLHQVVESIDINNVQSLTKGICFIGFECDLGANFNERRTGSKDAPNHIRKCLMSLPYNFANDIKLYDAGNVVASGSIEESQRTLSDVVSKIRKLGLIPIILGGGHELVSAAYKSVDEKNGLGVINFNAHFDNQPYDKGLNNATSLSEIYDECNVNGNPFNVMSIGIQRFGNTKFLFERAKEMGIDHILAHHFNKGIDGKAVAFVEKCKDVYISFCMDSFKSSMSPGVSSPTPLGLEPSRALEFMKKVIKFGKVSMIDFSEVNPTYDNDGITGRLVAEMIFEIIEMYSRVF